MDLLSFFVISILKLSALASSAYISLIIAETLLSKRSEHLRNQAFGFLVLFFTSLLIYMAI